MIMAEKQLKHYGILRKSGRYPWGSGGNPQQRSKTFLGMVDDLKKEGLTDVEISKSFGMSTSELRAQKSIAKSAKRAADSSMALRLKDKGYSNIAIGERMGINESSVRSLLDPALKERSAITNTTTKVLKEAVKNKGYIDVGIGVERHLGISRSKLQTAVFAMKDQGYKVHYVPVEQLGTGKKTHIMVLTDKDKTYSNVYKNKDKISLVMDSSDDGGRSYTSLDPISSVSSNRVMIRYKEDGGNEKDGLIEIRRNTPDLSLGAAKYAQVRIGVDNTHFMKGMAMYSDSIPKGVDIVYNTNKTRATPKQDIFKKMKDDPENPFGATIKQKKYIDSNGKEKTSSINIVNEEGDWGKWSKNLSSQFLSKQSPSLAKKQLGLVYKEREDEFNEINSLTNPAVKKKLLDAFADNCDSASVHLKAAALPRQATYVILPFKDMKDTEIYAPKFRNGERVALVRYPHGGTFEIPELTVNNKQRSANRVMKQAEDAVGISSKVAERLSGADFDGDFVLVIPNSKGIIKSTAPLKGLKDFDTITAYPSYEGMKKISKRTKEIKMGEVSNLITDMTIKGATPSELARAVRHSMVVIDAEKHNLNYKQSYNDNGIKELKNKYQGSNSGGASTLLSRASSPIRVGTRKESVDLKTGKKVYEYKDETYVNRSGKLIKKTARSTRMAEVSDAHELSSGTQMESIYADHANKLKTLANKARKTSIDTKPIPYSPTARQAYSKEVASLKAKLNIALKNAPLERKAQLVANKEVTLKKESNPDMGGDEIKKLKGQSLVKARLRVGAGKTKIEITDSEWKAIQAGAVSNNTQKQILNNTDLDKIKQRATPREDKGKIPTSKAAKIRRMLSNGYTQAEVADAVGVSLTTIAKVK
jgi:DNA-binding NarL/FixJ family response regulator